MAVTITHSTVATLPDEPGAEVNKAEWNAAHSVVGLGTAAEADTGDFDAAGTAAAAVAAHEAAGDPHPQYLTAAEGDALFLTPAEGNSAYEAAGAVATHAAAADPHTGYQKESEKGNANGYASLDGSGLVPDAQIPSTIARDTEVATAISDHEAATNPHPTYLTQAEGDAAYAALAHATSHQSGGADAIKLDDLAAPDDNTDLDASTTKHGLMQKYPGGTTNFLRADGAFAAPPGGGGLSVTETEVNLGSTAAWRGQFTITDANIGVSSRVLVWQAPGPYTGKGTRSDEAEMDWIQCHAVPAAGSATVRWRSVEGYSGNEGDGSPRRAAVIGRVRGNVKFHYAIGA